MFADNNVNFEARKMSVYNQRWNDEQQAVPRAPRHDRHPGSGHPANLPANIRVLRPPAPERPDELDALPEENHDAEVFIYLLTRVETKIIRRLEDKEPSLAYESSFDIHWVSIGTNNI